MILGLNISVIDNINDVIDFVMMNWESSDDVWWLNIDVRLKDINNYNRCHDTGKKVWYMKSIIDSTSGENHVGYVIVRGRNVEECIGSILNAIVILYPWSAKEYGSRYVYSSGNGEAIKDVCNFFYARAYITLNKRSMKDVVAESRRIRCSGIGDNVRVFQRVIGRSREIGLYGLIDCDVNDYGGNNELNDYLRENNVSVLIDRPSPCGFHKVIRSKDADGLDFGFMDKYSTNNKPYDRNTKFKPDASFLVYSALG